MSENIVSEVLPVTDPVIVPYTPPPKKFPFFALVLTVLLSIVSAICVYLFLQVRTLTLERATPSPTPSPVAAVDPTLDWQTYTNMGLGYEIKYPSFMAVDTVLNDEHNRFTSIKGNDIDVSIMLRKYSGDIQFDSYYYMDNDIAYKSTLGDKDANVYVQDVMGNTCVNDGPGPECPKSFVAYVAINGNDLYVLEFYGHPFLSDTEKEILSTFKFISQ